MMNSRKKPVILFLHNKIKKINYKLDTYHWLASQIGFRSYVSSWKEIQVENGKVFILNGYEAISSKEKRNICEKENIQPDIILHRKFIQKKSKKLLSNISEVLPNTIFSYDPFFNRFSRKGISELCFRNNKKDNVSRPRTYVCDKNKLLFNLIL